MTVLAHLEGVAEDDPDFAIHTLSLPADRVLPR